MVGLAAEVRERAIQRAEGRGMILRELFQKVRLARHSVGVALVEEVSFC